MLQVSLYQASPAVLRRTPPATSASIPSPFYPPPLPDSPSFCPLWSVSRNVRAALAERPGPSRAPAPLPSLSKSFSVRCQHSSRAHLPSPGGLTALQRKGCLPVSRTGSDDNFQRPSPTFSRLPLFFVHVFSPGLPRRLISLKKCPLSLLLLQRYTEV